MTQYRHPCANLSCANHLAQSELRSKRPTSLCSTCRMRWQDKGLPAGGYIPNDALRDTAKHILRVHCPTLADSTQAVRMARGVRHRAGKWTDRPSYSYNILMAHTPRYPASQRLPHLLIGRRKTPTLLSILSAASHYHIAQQHLGVGRRYARGLVGATFMGRRKLIRPTGNLGSLRGRDVKGNYQLRTTDFEIIGTHILRITKEIGIDQALSHTATVIYLQGVQEGRYNGRVIVPTNSHPTTRAGDHPLDHYLPDIVHWSPQHSHGLRRASGRIDGKWPTGLDIPRIERTTNRLNQIAYEAGKTPTYIPQSSDTDWLFSGN